jgi:hypothetical protein
MNNSLVYRLSLGFTILLTLAAFITLLGWLGTLINGVGRLPVLALLPWKTMGMVALIALNCTIRAHFIIRRSPMGVTE